MFSINPFLQGSSPNQVTPNDLNSFFNFLQEAQRQEQEKQQQLRAQQAKPRVVKKIENEDGYQIQIFKPYGNFNNYEVKVVKIPSYNQSIINVILQSKQDQFKKVFQFKLDDILYDQINWELYKSENILILNIPKRVKVCHTDSFENLFNAFGFPIAQLQQQQQQQQAGPEVDYDQLRRSQFESRARQEAELKARHEAELKARREAELKLRQEAADLKARQEAEYKARKEALAIAEKLRKEAELKAKREREAQLAAAEKARKEAELNAKKEREAQIKAKKEALIKAKKEQKLKEQKQKEAYEQYLQQQQAFFNQFFDNNLYHEQSPFQFIRPISRQQQEEQSQQSSSEKRQPTVETPPSSDVESENSTPDSSPVIAPVSLSPSSSTEKRNARRSPVLGELNDEEYVLFNKKFHHDIE
ncbi:hypothetical protein DFJ63DRAFT_333367 [Scheffersomyces coipomensis]|uniref:uncharacterized protein n=1 Tax=Scheffersomyces coipomensis TaxID=1788519 RepID=UPI00315CBB32